MYMICAECPAHNKNPLFQNEQGIFFCAYKIGLNLTRTADAVVILGVGVHTTFHGYAVKLVEG